MGNKILGFNYCESFQTFIKTYENDVDIFSCYVRNDNIASMSLFKKLGFIINNSEDEQIDGFIYLERVK